MRDVPCSSPAVVVGIDGSRTAVDAALWAVDEAVSRDFCADLRTAERTVSTRLDSTYGVGFTW
jgi:hypothetical protein